MAYGMAGVTEPRKQIHVAEPYDPFDYKELHHLEGLLLFDKGQGARGGPRRRPRPQGRSAVLPSRAAPRGRQPDRRGRPGRDRRALLAALREAGLARSRKPERGVAQAGRPHASRDRRGDGSRRRPATTATQLETPLAATPATRCRTWVPLGIGASRTRSALATPGMRASRSAGSSTASGRPRSSAESAACAIGYSCHLGCSASGTSGGTDAWLKVETTGVVRRSRICNVLGICNPSMSPSSPR